MIFHKHLVWFCHIVCCCYTIHSNDNNNLSFISDKWRTPWIVVHCNIPQPTAVGAIGSHSLIEEYGTRLLLCLTVCLCVCPSRSCLSHSLIIYLIFLKLHGNVEFSQGICYKQLVAWITSAVSDNLYWTFYTRSLLSVELMSLSLGQVIKVICVGHVLMLHSY